MLRKFAIALVLLVAVPVSGAIAQGQGKAAKQKGNCDQIARAQSPGVGQSAVACYPAALARCQQRR